MVQADHLGGADRALAALDLDHHAIMDTQAVGRHVFGLGNTDAAAQF